MVVRAKAARVGTYDYAGREVDPDNKHGLRDMPLVKVLRDEAAVFDAKAVHSFIGKPITDDHPTEAVTSTNWRDHARGTIMGAKWEEGGYLAFDLMLTDADAIAKVNAGKRELSNGYSAALEFGDFTAADGTKCQARQASITGNHVALVDKGRAGPECAITDAALCSPAPQALFDTLTTEKPVMKKMLIDGLTVDIADADTAEKTINTLIAARDAAAGKVTDLEKAVATKDAEIVKLTADKTALEAAKPTPAQLRDAAKAFALVCDKAKAAGVTVTDAMDESAIVKAVVDTKMGAKASGYTVDQYATAFDVLTVDAKTTVHPLGSPTVVTDAATKDASDAYAAMVADMHKPTTAAE
jgi:hypothetical protein